MVDIPEQPGAIALCPDFQFGSWRYKQLAKHLFDWLPDVALRPRERDALIHEPFKQLAKSCHRLFDVEDPERRGEIGEILLHAICRQEFETAPFVARLFYKMRTNDSVTSVDVVHVLFNPITEKLELWLGEAKLHDDLNSAKYKALKSVEPLWSEDFLEEMKALIGPKIEGQAPHVQELNWLFEEETSLDQIVDRLVIPICLACNFEATESTSTRSEEYVAKVAAELADLRAYFKERVPVEVRFICIFVPMDCKEKLETEFNAKVQAFL